MEFSFTIDDLTRQLSKSKQSLYLLFNKNKTFINQNSIRKQRKIFYNQAVLDYLTDYYTHGAPVEAPTKPIEAPSPEDRGDAAQSEIDALRAKIAVLEAQLEAKEAERAELFKQNSQLLLLLSQEKAEKALYLPAPRKSIGERFRSLFGR